MTRTYLFFGPALALILVAGCCPGEMGRTAGDLQQAPDHTEYLDNLLNEQAPPPIDEISTGSFRAEAGNTSPATPRPATGQAVSNLPVSLPQGSGAPAPLSQALGFPPTQSAVPSRTVRAPAVPSRAATTHSIQRGDTLWSLARLYYNDSRRWGTILAANPGINPNKLQVGSSLMIP
ncbi:MAG: LysM peptidoglycan-binding domain-containing protein [Phycisphaerae bacterium]|nr:LysM peptidoglycan-binding domain-containing protein [Phycisphaerae bacterium]